MGKVLWIYGFNDDEKEEKQEEKSNKSQLDAIDEAFKTDPNIDLQNN